MQATVFSLLLALVLGGCGGGGGEETGAGPDPLPPPAPAPSNQPPEISGTPAQSVRAGQTYVFTPVSSDGDGDSLSFSVANLPGWASFDTATGTVSGTPSLDDAGIYSAIAITVTDGTDTGELPSFSITVIGNAAPEISGTPSPTAMTGVAYRFTPSARDADGDSLSFSIGNLPSWAGFDTATGALTGTPSAGDIGTYSEIVISVTDGTTAVALDAFSITVTDSAPGAAMLHWSAPVLDANGASLTDLEGFKVYYGTTSGTYPNVIDVPGAGASSHLVENLAPATYFFVVTAYDTLGNESGFSNETSKVVH